MAPLPSGVSGLESGPTAAPVALRRTLAAHAGHVRVDSESKRLRVVVNDATLAMANG